MPDLLTSPDRSPIRVATRCQPEGVALPVKDIFAVDREGELMSNVFARNANEGRARKAPPLAWKSSGRAIQTRLYATFTRQHSAGKPGTPRCNPQCSRSQTYAR